MTSLEQPAPYTCKHGCDRGVLKDDLFAAEEFMAVMLEVLESVDKSETSLSDRDMMREARKFLERARRA